MRRIVTLHSGRQSAHARAPDPYARAVAQEGTEPRIGRRLFLGGGVGAAVGGAAALYAPSASAQTAACDRVLPFTRTGRLTVSRGRVPYVPPTGITILGISLAVGIEPLGADIIVDVHHNGATIFSDQGLRPRIAAGAAQSAGEAVPTSTTFAAGVRFTIDVDQVGSDRPGSDLSVVIRYQ